MSVVATASPCARGGLPSWARAIEIGRMWPLHVRRERVIGFNLPRPRTLLYASDLHLGWPWTTPVAMELVDLAALLRPDVTLLGGDLADRPAGLESLSALIAGLANVYAIAGNHDLRLGETTVRASIEAAGGRWLDGHLLRHAFDDGTGIDLDGGSFAPGGSGRRVLVAHDPSVFPRAAAAGYPLVLAGHLHGGQCVLATPGDILHPGCWFARWTGLRFRERGATMLVSRGAADTLPLRFNCPREVILCTIH